MHLKPVNPNEACLQALEPNPKTELAVFGSLCREAPFISKNYTPEAGQGSTFQ